MTEREFLKEYLCEPSPVDECMRACYEAAEIYERETDKFDAEICTHGKSKRGEPIPVTAEERRLSNDNAKAVRARLTSILSKRYPETSPDELWQRVQGCLLQVRQRKAVAT